MLRVCFVFVWMLCLVLGALVDGYLVLSWDVNHLPLMR
ncbi:putative membrane protein [Synechococcus sp. BIOS-E4-1]|nr:putative membrane protein [Synechococcus sp. BIOS-E4-1]